MRHLLLTLVLSIWGAPALADPPAPGDLIYFDSGDCAVMHLDPASGIADIISRWGCNGATGSTVGTGPTDWTPSNAGGEIGASPDGWIYTKSYSGGANLYRIDPGSGDREFVAAIPSVGTAFQFLLWPDPGFFTPTVAGLSAGAAALLVGMLVGSSLRRGKQRNHCVSDLGGSVDRMDGT